MPFLQDAENAARLARITPDGVELLSAWRSRLKRMAGAAISGHLGYVGPHPAAVYLADGHLWAALAGDAWHLSELSARFEADEHVTKVSIATPRQAYEAVVEPLAADDLTPLADAEDFSFALWMARIILDEERQSVLLDALEDARADSVPEHARADAPVSSFQMPHPWSTSTLRRGGQHSAD